MTRLFPGMPLPVERLGAKRDPQAEAKEMRKLREGFGMTQVQMSQILDVSAATYYRWESGRVLCPLMAIMLMRCWEREAVLERAKKKAAGRK